MTLINALFCLIQFNLEEDRLAGGYDQEVLTDHLHRWVAELDLHHRIGHTFEKLDYAQTL